MNPRHMEAVFSALADPTRRELMSKLSQGPVSATGLSRGMPVTRQAVSKHLAALAEAGLVEAERSGREVLYRLTPGPLNEAASWMADVGADWDDRLARMRSMLQRRPRRA